MSHLIDDIFQKNQKRKKKLFQLTKQEAKPKRTTKIFKKKSTKKIGNITNEGNFHVKFLKIQMTIRAIFK